MKIEALPDDLVEELLLPDKPIYASDAEMVICPYCGFCEDPIHCVWSVQCRTCCAPPSQHCLDDRGAVTALHKERWEDARNRSDEG